MNTPNLSRRRSIWALALSAAASAAIATPVRHLLVSRGIYDVPNHRSSHASPTPRGGGIATLLGGGAAALTLNTRPTRTQTLSILGLAGMGLIDDLSGHVPASLRLAGQMSVGAFTFGPGAWDRAVSALVTAGVVNVVNFMDGINGISGMTAIVWGVNTMFASGVDGNLTALGALTAGAGLGFLPHNAPRAHLFLGDVGSYAMGAAFVTGLLSPQDLHTKHLVSAPLMLYATDATQAILKRGMAGQRLTEAHREHVYQRLVDRGLSHMQVAAIHAGGALLLAITARLPPLWRFVSQATICVAYLCLPRLRLTTPLPAHTSDPQTLR